MFFEILKRDIRRKRTMNIIILLFVVLAGTFIASSVSNLTAIMSSLDTYFEKVGVGDYSTVERGKVGRSSAEIAEGLAYVDDVRVEPILFNSDGIEYDGETLVVTDFVIISSIDQQIQKYYDSENHEITEVPEGSVYVRKSWLDKAELSVGDEFTLPIGDTRVHLTVKGELKDAVFGSMLMGTPRFVVSQADYDKLMADKNSAAYGGAITSVDTDDVKALQQELNECKNILFSGSKDKIKFTYIIEMLVAGILMIVSVCLIIIALVILRFTITFTLSEEFREIGIMKAIGIPNPKIRALYLVKYLAISIVGAFIGLIASIPFGNLMLTQAADAMVIFNSGKFWLSGICSVGVVGIVLLFCYRSTRMVKKFTPVDAIRNGSTGERYKKKGVLRLSKRKGRPVPFLACNDILSGMRRFGIMLVTFTVGILLIMIVLNAMTTLQSGKLVSWFSLADGDVFLMDKEKLSTYMTEDGREALETDLEEMQKTLGENGMPAEVFAEVSNSFTISKGELSTHSLTFEGVNTTTDMYHSYIEGTPPRNKNEIAVTYVIADRLDAAIGDTVTVKSPEGDRDYMISAIYQSMTNQGEGIRFHQDERYSFASLNGVWATEIRFTDEPSQKELAQRMEKIRELYPDYEVKTPGEYVDYVVNGISSYMSTLKLLIILIVMLINLLVAVLMEKTFLTKERGEIAMLKAVGFGNGAIIRWQVLRIAIVMVVATVLAILLCNPVSQISTGAVFRLMGAKTIIFDVNVLESYVLYPLLILAATVFGVFLTALPVCRIQSNEINSVE